MLFGIEPIGVYAFAQFPDAATFEGFTEIICVHWEDRAMSVASENRAAPVPAETRSMSVLFEARTNTVEVKKEVANTDMSVAAEDRAMSAGPRKRVC